MALTKISRSLLDTGISDSSDATAITIDSSENILLSNTTSLIGVNTSDGSDNKSVMINGGGAASSSRGAYIWAKGNEHSSNPGFLQLTSGSVSGAAITAVTNGTERMRILSDGKVGIGTTSPSKLLTISGDDAEFLLNRTGTYADTINMGAPGGVPTIAGGTHLAFGGNGAWNEHMRINSSGNVLVGNTDGLAKFSVGNGSGNALIEMASSSATAVYYEHINRGNTSGNVSVGYYARASGNHVFYTGSYTARFTIDATGGNDGSDRKLKENIEDISYGLDTVKSLQPRKFKWKDTGDQGIGFIAQEVESLIPELISEVPDDLRNGTEEKTKMLHYGAITSVLTKAIQEQQEQIEALQSEINLLKGE